MDPSPTLIEVLEDIGSEALRAEAWAAVSQKRWFFGNKSVGKGEPAFWKMDLNGDAATNALWLAEKSRCEALAQSPLTVLRQYANGHTFGLGGLPHQDAVMPGFFTLLYYPMLKWDPQWAGQTTFHDPSGEIIRAVLPKPGRAVLFDSRILHAGHAPARAFGGLRVTIAWKLGPPAP